MTKPVTVINKDGKQIVRADGVLLDGDMKHVSFMMVDGKPNPAAIFIKDSAPTSAATLANAAQILGDGYNEAEIAKLTDQAARHAVVRKRIGAAADGRSAAYLDAAWAALAETGNPPAVSVPSTGGPPMPVLTDAQRAHAARAVERAVADAGKPAQQQRGGPMTDAERKAGSDRIRGAYAAMCADMSSAWKPQAQRDAEARAVTLDPRDEARFRDGRIADNPVNRAKAEMARTLENGWKEDRR